MVAYFMATAAFEESGHWLVGLWMTQQFPVKGIICQEKR
jgi:hypothetical protein